MKPNAKSILMLGIVLSLLLLVRGVQAEGELNVEIDPPTPSVASHSHSNDITEESLKEGKTKYMLTSDPEDSHRTTLTKQQVSDILDGTTIIIRSSMDKDGGKLKAHQHGLGITFTAEEPESSGW